MSHLFSKKAKTKSDNTSELPRPPTTDQIIEDLETAKPDDIVFTTDIGLVHVEKVVQQDLFQTNFSLQRRFQKTGNSSPDIAQKPKNSEEKNSETPTQEHREQDLYEKVIEYNQNVEKLINLHQALPKVYENLTQLHEELEEDKNRVSDTYKEALKLYEEVNAQEGGNHKYSGNI